jgi:hypothetical protein
MTDKTPFQGMPWQICKSRWFMLRPKHFFRDGELPEVASCQKQMGENRGVAAQTRLH